MKLLIDTAGITGIGLIVGSVASWDYRAGMGVLGVVLLGGAVLGAWATGPGKPPK